MASSIDIQRARQILSRARRPVVFSGAGVSADSGVPTFRGASSADTFWGKYDPMQLASPRGFAEDPALVYNWYTMRRSQLASLRPNPAHHAIADLQRRQGAIIITQNVDGLHERIAPPGAVIHCVHGTLARDRCTFCQYTEAVDFQTPPPLRNCPECAGKLRPAVVWFGESLDQALWQVCLHACAGSDVLLVVGTSGEVYPAAGLVDVSARAGATVVLANLEPGLLDASADILLRGRAADIIPLIVPPGG